MITCSIVSDVRLTDSFTSTTSAVPSTRDQSHARGSYAQRRQEQEAEPWLKLEVRQKDEEPSRAKRAKLEPAGS